MCNKNNVILDLNNIDLQNIYVLEPIKNTIIPDGEFRRIIYSCEYMTLNNITLHINVPNAKIQKYYQKYKCFLNETMEKEIKFLIDLENHILQNIHHCYKHRKANLLEQVRNGFIKFFYTNEPNINNTNIMQVENFTLQIKISGIWETDDEYGITYKVISL